MSQSILAGKTFLEKLEGDPRALESWKWAQAQLKAFSEGVEALRPEFERLDADWLNEFGEPVPHTIEDLQRWLARADVPGRFLPADKIASGKWTATDIMPYVEGYLLQLSDQKKARGVLPEAPASVGRPKRKRGGQKTYDTNADKKLADKWETAKRNGAYKAEFARDNGYRVKEFDRLLNRVRASKAKT